MHLDPLTDFARRALRRPLTGPQQDDVVALYRHLRHTDGLDHEEAIRDSVVRILMSPAFCYRVDRFIDQGNEKETPKGPTFSRLMGSRWRIA